MKMRSLLFGVLCFWLATESSIGAQDVPEKISIGTWNLEWFYDNDKGDNLSKLSKEKSAPSQDEWDWKLNSVASVIGKTKPYIMAFQEVENRKVIFDLKNVLRSKYKLSYRIAFVEGFDTFTEQDVAVLFQDGLVEMSRREQNAEQWKSKQFKNLSKHVWARFEWGTGDKKEKLTLLNMHLRAMPERENLRIQQVKLAREWINDEFKSTSNIVVVGDLNTEHAYGTEKKDSDVGTLRGLHDADPSNDLTDAHQFIEKEKRSTHMIGKQFDRVLFSKALSVDQPNRRDLVFSKAWTTQNLVVRGDVDQGDLRWQNVFEIPQAERDISDHYPVFAEFEFK